MIRKIVSIVVLILCLQSLQAQVFREVGCKVLKGRETKALGIYNNNLVYSQVDSMCGLVINGIALWDTAQWKPFGDVFAGGSGPSSVRAFATYNNEFYVGGGFHNMNGNLMNKISRWNGTGWNSVGSGLHMQGNQDKVSALAVYKGELYVAGKFQGAGGLTNVNHIARWNGTQWKKVGGGVLASLPEAYCMAVYKGELYLGGNFFQAGSATAYNIARWNGSQWKAVGKGTNNPVRCMVVDTVKNVLYVAGWFNRTDDTIPGYVSMWDGNQWYQVGNPDMFEPIASISSLEMYHNYLYAGGNANRYDGTDTMFARWDGQAWENIPGIKGGSITCLQTYKDELYIGGNFTKIGNDSIPNLTRYYSPDTVVVGIRQERKNVNTLKVYPNPSGDRITIQSELKFESVRIVDVRGKTVLSVKRPIHNSIDISNLSPGVYFLSAITSNKQVYNSSFVNE